MHEPWSLLCEIGLIGWLVAAAGFIICTFPSRDIFEKRPAAVWGGCLLFFYAIWITGMLKA